MDGENVWDTLALRPKRAGRAVKSETRGRTCPVVENGQRGLNRHMPEPYKGAGIPARTGQKENPLLYEREGDEDVAELSDVIIF